MIVGATPENDFQMLSVTQALYHNFGLKRVFYSAYVPVNEDSHLPSLPGGPPLLREHRLYQADWLLRYYHFEAGELLDEENAIMAKNNDLWEKVFASMSKNVTEDMLSSNYGDVLMAAVDGAKDQFTDAEYETLKSDAEQIRKIEEEIAALPTDSSEEQTSDASGTAFPQFEGKDLDGNKVDSSVFAENAVTVVNFWFNECKPCVEELSEMNALNDRLKEQGGEVLGVNVGALDGDEQNIATAKQILETKGAKYRNIYFDSDSDAGKFALGVTAFPTTYVIDRNGNIVGEALMGGIDNDDNLNTKYN